MSLNGFGGTDGGVGRGASWLDVIGLGSKEAGGITVIDVVYVFCE